MRKSTLSSFPKRMSIKSRTLFVRRLTIYLRAGITLIEAIELVTESAERNQEKKIFTFIANDIKKGFPLSHTLSQFPKIFTPEHIQLVMVGEMSGTLTNSLDRLSEMLTRRGELKRKIMSALLYPVIILAGTVMVSSFLLFYTFPKIIPLFRGLHAKLPFTTRTLIWIFDQAHNHGTYIFLTVLTLIVSLSYLARRPVIRARIDTLLIRLPIIGQLLHDYYLSVVFRTLSTMLKSGVRIDVALAHTKESNSQYEYQRAVTHMEQTTLGGGTCSSSMRMFPHVFTTTSVQIISAGEITGTLPQSATTVAELSENDLDAHTKTLTTLIEPILMVVMGFMVGFIALAIISPMYSLTQNLSTH